MNILTDAAVGEFWLPMLKSCKAIKGRPGCEKLQKLFGKTSLMPRYPFLEPSFLLKFRRKTRVAANVRTVGKQW